MFVRKQVWLYMQRQESVRLEGRTRLSFEEEKISHVSWKIFLAEGDMQFAIKVVYYILLDNVKNCPMQISITGHL